MIIGQDLTQALDKLELSQNGFARLGGWNPRTVRRWISGELEIPRHVEVLLHVLVVYDVDLPSIPGFDPTS